MKLKLLFIFVFLANTHFANAFLKDGINYYKDCSPYTDNCTVGVVQLGSGNYYSGNITIPSTVSYEGTTYNVTRIYGAAFQNCSGLTSINLPNSITQIGEGVFSDCSGLTSITLPNTITSIERSTFSNCSRLTSITLPNSVTSIDNLAFTDCASLTSITLPNSVTSIGSSAFTDCASLTSITIPNSVTSIGTLAFSNCTSLTDVILSNAITRIEKGTFFKCTSLPNITLPNSITYIGEGAFYLCSSLSNITLSDSLTTIYIEAFSDCTSLKSINIPSSITSISYVAFKNCTSLNSFKINKSSPLVLHSTVFSGVTLSDVILEVPSGSKSSYESATIWKDFGTINEVTFLSIGDTFMDGGINYKTTTNTTVEVIAKDSGEYSGAITIPSTVNYSGTNYNITAIGESAFFYNSITSISLPNSITSVKDSAFRYCTNLTSITLPNSVISIGNSAFRSCYGLTSITFPDSLVSIGDWAFFGCQNLTSVTLPNSVTSIGELSFSECQNLSSVSLSESLESIGNQSFYNCTSLTNVTAKNTTAISLSSSIFDNVNISSATLIVPSGSLSTYQSAPVWQDFGTIAEDVTLDTKEIDFNEKLSITFYQNILEIKTDENIKEIKLFNIGGSLIKQGNLNTMNLTDILTGLYVLNVTTDKGIYKKKIVKQ